MSQCGEDIVKRGGLIFIHLDEYAFFRLLLKPFSLRSQNSAAIPDAVGRKSVPRSFGIVSKTK
jgi:hypothetical protein